MKYILTYTETTGGTTGKGESFVTASTDTEAIEQVQKLLEGKEVTDITLWRRGDFVILGREAI